VIEYVISRVRLRWASLLIYAQFLQKIPIMMQRRLPRSVKVQLLVLHLRLLDASILSQCFWPSLKLACLIVANWQRCWHIQFVKLLQQRLIILQVTSLLIELCLGDYSTLVNSVLALLAFVILTHRWVEILIFIFFFSHVRLIFQMLVRQSNPFMNHLVLQMTFNIFVVQTCQMSIQVLVIVKFVEPLQGSCLRFHFLMYQVLKV